MILEYNELFDGILYYRIMTMYMNHFNQTNYSEKYIHRIMKELHIKARIRRKDTFDLALERNHNAKPIFHSDRDFQYTSKQFKVKLDQARMIQSLSGVDKYIDNRPMEGFQDTLKSEAFYGLHFGDET